MAITTLKQGLKNVDADIPSNYSRLIARELGLSVRELPSLLRNTGVDVEQLLKDESLLTATQQIQILRNALDLSGKPEFGLRLGRRLTPATHGVMGFVANS
ncbi:AraC family transcriptional regulator ligand-binding domain-containing protein, partial [Alcanivorax sp. HI0044]